MLPKQNHKFVVIREAVNPCSCWHPVKAAAFVRVGTML